MTAHGHPLPPPSNQIENPNPLSGTNNWYTQDRCGGGSYVKCADDSEPGVAPIRAFIKVPANCDPDHYYLVNNYGAAYAADGSLVNTTAHPFTLPPQTLPNIATALSDAGVSWRY